MQNFSLFDDSEVSPPVDRSAPLAARMRPRTLDEFEGQQHLLGEGRLLRAAIEQDRLTSLIFWGPPGSGKTTLAQVIAGISQSSFVALSAVTAGVADLRKAIEEARRRRSVNRQHTILLIDEIHRFNKAQQDAVLHAVEQGIVTLIGATTENPSFEVNSALLSRCRVFTLEALSDENVEVIVRRAVDDRDRGLGSEHVRLDDGALRHLITIANGDARVALTALELAALAVQPREDGWRVVSLPTIEEALQHRALLYDAHGDQHYDQISAFIKSVRGSDPDAAIYWLARMLEAGEDLMFVARRIVILASEDVGLADPNALPVAVAAQQAAHLLGLPEAIYPLGEAALYLATAPKSNSTKRAYWAAVEDVQRTRADPVPLHLRNAPTGLMRELGYGSGYRYAHDFEGARVDQQHLPDNLRGRRYFEPSDRGYERQIREYLAKSPREPARSESPGPNDHR